MLLGDVYIDESKPLGKTVFLSDRLIFHFSTEMFIVNGSTPIPNLNPKSAHLNDNCEYSFKLTKLSLSTSILNNVLTKDATNAGAIFAVILSLSTSIPLNALLSISVNDGFLLLSPGFPPPPFSPVLPFFLNKLSKAISSTLKRKSLYSK